MKKIIVSFVLAALLGATASAQTSRNDVVDFGAPQPLTITSQSGEHTFMVEEAKTLDQQARGMMFREEMDENSGMIFEFSEPKVATIWMKNTAIPLDILFVRSNGKILKIEHMAQPYKLRSASSEAVVAAVLELKGGRSLELGIQPGDTIKHTFFGNSAP
ncbi:hypothetical protein DES40_0729 [Litorimonas taeanensis]|uniref:DUF192 domain-containing protein n=1 Tax=Litorimonas taeanensis TaxID=568099 RepID=A0A420WK46_9PROT|nr:DUF192 domain-containing protein [Litorimonas taeanensis]RKQ71411.1 hypothetical protein DES40_0729 [Litorimonas taeanensis]